MFYVKNNQLYRPGICALYYSLMVHCEYFVIKVITRPCYWKIQFVRTVSRGCAGVLGRFLRTDKIYTGKITASVFVSRALIPPT